MTNERVELLPGFLLPHMIDNPCIWRAIANFAVRVLTEKEVAEREGAEQRPLGAITIRTT